MRRVLSLLLLSIGVIILMGARCDPKAPVAAGEPEGPPPEASVTLLGSTRRVAGMSILPYAHTAAVGVIEQPRPHRLTIRMPDGKSVTLESRNTSLTTSHGIVVDAQVRRPMGAVRFQEALADLRRTMEGLGIEPDERMRKQMAPWVGDFPGMEGGGMPYAFHAGGVPFRGGEVDVQISPLVGSGWDYTIFFQATVESRHTSRVAKHIATLPDIGPIAANERTLPAISAPLLESCTLVEGMRLHERLADSWLSKSEFPDPSRLTIGLPGGKSLAMTARAMALLTNYGVVQGVYARRPLRPLPFEEAVADLHSTLKELAIEPDAAMAEQMAAWPSEAPKIVEGVEPDDYRARTRVTGEVELEVRLISDQKGGWFTLWMFEATPEALKAPQAAAARVAAERDAARRRAVPPQQ